MESTPSALTESITVLVVEDDPAMSRLLGRVLVRPAFQVARCARLAEAKESVRSAAFDVVLLDLNLPDSDGLATLARLREEAPGVPVVVLTGRDQNGLSVRAIRHGAQDYILKEQVDAQLLIRTLRHAVERSRRAEPERPGAAQESVEAKPPAISLGVAVLDAAGRILSADSAWRRMNDSRQFLGLDLSIGVDLRQAFAADPGRTPLASRLGRGVLQVVEREREEFSMDFSPEARAGLPWCRLSAIRFEALGGVWTLLTAQRIADRRRIDRKGVEREKLAVLGRLAAGVAHELKAPLGAIAGLARQGLRELPLGSPATAGMETIAREAQRCRGLVLSILSLARREPPSRQAFDLNQVVAQALDLVDPEARQREVAVRRALSADPLPVSGNPELVRQALLNLCVNALDAMPDGGTLTVAALRVREEGIERAQVQVADTGQGIAPDDRSRVFDPFFTTKPPGQGVGLGLYLVREIVARHGGRVELSSRPGMGTVFKVILPLGDA